MHQPRILNTIERITKLHEAHVAKKSKAQARRKGKEAQRLHEQPILDALKRENIVEKDATKFISKDLETFLRKKKLPSSGTRAKRMAEVKKFLSLGADDSDSSSDEAEDSDSNSDESDDLSGDSETSQSAISDSEQSSSDCESDESD